MNIQAQTHFIAKVTGVVFLLNVLPQLASHLSFVMLNADAALLLTQTDTLRILASYGIQVIAGLVLLFGSGRVLQWLDRPQAAPEDVISHVSVEVVLVGLLGIYFVVTGLATIMFECGRIYASTTNHATAFDHKKLQLLNAEAIASIAYSLTQFVLGVVLVVRRQTIVAQLALIDRRFIRE
jgi:hypothetical protein